MSESVKVMRPDAPRDVVSQQGQKPLSPAINPERQAKIEEGRARSAVARAIRGTLWGKDLPPVVLEAVIAYCRQNQLDAVRHVEVLGGNIYLTATFYDERGAPLLHSGDVVFEEPDYINADARLDELAKAGDTWAVEEKARRLRERVKWNVPEKSTAAVVQRAKLRSGMVAVGVNWCGAGTKKDPVGDAEPSKTAQTRARRRCWRQIADFVLSYGAVVQPVEASAKNALPVAVIEPPEHQESIGKNFGTADDPYRLNAGATAPVETKRDETDAELLVADRELTEREPGEEQEELPVNDRRRRE